jgi:hypothetical protein
MPGTLLLHQEVPELCFWNCWHGRSFAAPQEHSTFAKGRQQIHGSEIPEVLEECFLDGFVASLDAATRQADQVRWRTDFV